MAHALVPEERLGSILAKMDWHLLEAQRLEGVRLGMLAELGAAAYGIDHAKVNAARRARLAELRSGRGAPAAGANRPVGDDPHGFAVERVGVLAQPDGDDLDVMRHGF